MKYRAIPVYFLLASISWSAHAQESGSRQSEDDRIVVSCDSIWRSESFSTGSFSVKVDPPGEVVTVWMTLVRVKSGHVGLTLRPVGERASLVDTDGGEHGEMFVLPKKSLYVEGKPEGVRGGIGEESIFIAIFSFPKAATPAVLKWTYAYWDSPESAEFEYAEIEIDVGAKDRPSPE